MSRAMMHNPQQDFRQEAKPMSDLPVPHPQLPAWCFQPDEDTPGLYLQCETTEQREAIMRLLGAPPIACDPAK